MGVFKLCVDSPLDGVEMDHVVLPEVGTRVKDTWSGF